VVALAVIAKPEAGIYKEALKVSGLKASEVVMIGDRIDTDICRIHSDQVIIRGHLC